MISPRTALSRGCIVLACALAAGPALAQDVSLHGMLGSKALLVIDGGKPQAVAVGQTRQGVTLLSASGEQAVVQVNGKEHTLQIGRTPIHVQNRQAEPGEHLTLYANAAGHFLTAGSINGRPVQFLVDTGASYVALSEAEAERLQVDWQRGRPVRMHTANGETGGRMIHLEEVRIGRVTAYGVDAVVTPLGMPAVLLGNSFLNRFDMQRTGSQMLLSSR